jgi:hypothetical protein
MLHLAQLLLQNLPIELSTAPIAQSLIANCASDDESNQSAMSGGLYARRASRPRNPRSKQDAVYSHGGDKPLRSLQSCPGSKFKSAGL